MQAKIFRIVFAAAAPFVLTAAAFAQTGSIRGRVTDENGQPVKDAMVYSGASGRQRQLQGQNQEERRLFPCGPAAWTIRRLPRDRRQGSAKDQRLSDQDGRRQTLGLQSGRDPAGTESPTGVRRGAFERAACRHERKAAQGIRESAESSSAAAYQEQGVEHGLQCRHGGAAAEGLPRRGDAFEKGVGDRPRAGCRLGEPCRCLFESGRDQDGRRAHGGRRSGNRRLPPS